ncbi:hypothetical protein D3C73_1477090 [compost metagenome]
MFRRQLCKQRLHAFEVREICGESSCLALPRYGRQLLARNLCLFRAIADHNDRAALLGHHLSDLQADPTGATHDQQLATVELFDVHLICPHAYLVVGRLCR